ncbi:MAG: glycosyltransferase family 2 protein [Paracoccus sp. (in: a-proteobacteria)]|nr:glycosyltransferase family 2 protein [Paracoccus sp. (in: a-proteobacteria)]
MNELPTVRLAPQITGETRRFRLVVSIINYRTGPMTWDCVRSVLDDLSGRQDAMIAVIDNDSGDGSADFLAGRIDGLTDADSPVRLIRSATNSGFSGGHNQGLTAAEADYYLVLNSDAVLRPGFCATILDAAASAPTNVGLFAPQLEYDDGEVQVSLFRFPSPVSEIIRGANTGPVTRLLRRWDIPLETRPDPDQIGWASFACILLKGEMVRRIGPMDEGYFLYFEDAEYCLRARRAGWRIAHVPAARAVHFRGGSGPVKALATRRKRLPAYFYASRSRFMRQAAGAGGPIAANLGWMLGRGVARFRRLFGKPIPPGIEGEPRDIWINSLRPLTGGDRKGG